MNKRLINFIFYGLIIFVIAGMIVIIFLLKGEGSECMKNPFVYGAKGVIQGDQESVSCSCYVGHKDIGLSNFCFDDQELKVGDECLALKK